MESNSVRISEDYLDSKINEAHIALEYALKKEEEKEQLREERECEREEVGEKKGRIEGEKKGQQQGLKTGALTLVASLKDVGCTSQQILQQLKQKYGNVFSDKQLEEFLKQS